MTDLTGQYMGRYHIIEPLGEGGMATVYKAYDTHLERDVAIKVIRTDQFSPASLKHVLQRFEREAKSLAQLSHPNIVKIHDYGEFQGSPFLVMEYLPGGTLRRRVGRPMPWRNATRLLLPIARGLAYAHSHNIIHRDIKPSNILMTESGEPMLSDFGVAKILEGEDGQTLTATGVGIGTPGYMAPEQWSGNTSPQSDIYSLGMVFYELITGRKPYTADTPAAILIKQVNEPLPHPSQFVPGLPEIVEKVLFKALARKPEDRFSDMDAFAKALEYLSTEGNAKLVPAKRLVSSAPAQDKRAATVAEISPTQYKRLEKQTTYNRFQIFLIGTLVVVLVSTLAVALWFSRRGTAPTIEPPTGTAFLTPTEILTPSITPSITPTNMPAVTIWPMTKPVFEYPATNQTMAYEKDYTFQVQPIPYAGGFLWGFSQNDALIWENFRDTGKLDGNIYNIPQDSLAHTKFQPGNVDVIVRAQINGQWTDATIITIKLDVFSKPTIFPANTPTPIGLPSGGIILLTTGINWDQTHQISMMDSNGSNVRQIIYNTPDSCGARLSPDGKKIVYCLPEGNNQGYIYTSNLDGSDVMRLAPSAERASPDWSPDGKLIAFTCKDMGICIMNTDGSNIRQLTATNDEHPRWSHSGQRIAFVTYRDGDAEIYVMDRDGANQINLTNDTNEYDGEPDWSPDDSKIAFSRNKVPYHDYIFIMNSDGTDIHAITDDQHNEFPIWSPDGKQILFTSNRSGQLKSIYLMNTDGTNPTLLYKTDGNPLDWKR